jgi:hypothetical protein
MIILLGAFAGGAVAWLWGALSWGVLPWHHATFRSFADEDAVLGAVAAACPASGVYGLPAPPRHSTDMDKTARAAADRAAQQRMQSGPIVTAIVQRGGFGSVPLALLRAFAIYALTSGVLMWVLRQTAPPAYWHGVAVVTAVGLASGLMCRLTDWNWHGYSTDYTLVNIADHVVGAFLVGLVLAAL